MTIVKVGIDVHQHETPAEVKHKINVLSKWRSHRAAKDLDVEILDEAVKSLQEYHDILVQARLQA